MNGRGQNAEISKSPSSICRTSREKTHHGAEESLEDFAQIQVFGQILVANVGMCPIGSFKKHVKQWSPCAAAEFLKALSSSNSIFLSLIFAISQVFVCFSTVIGV